MVKELETTQTIFDENAYTVVLGEYTSALQGPIRIDDASSLSRRLKQDSTMFHASLGSRHFQSTLSFIDRLTRLSRTPSNGELVNTIPGFTKNVLHDISTHIQEDPETYLLPSYQVARACIRTSDSQLNAIATEIFSKNFDLLLAAPEIGNDDANVMLKHVIATANADQIRIVAKAAITPSSPLKQRFPRPIDSVLNISLLGQNTYERPARMTAILDEITGGYAERLLNAWDASDGKREDRSKGSEKVYIENFGIVCQIEKRRPGITKLLIEEYGLMSFGRYPVDLLIDQYDTHEKDDLPYGIYIAARHDFNGVIYADKAELTHAYQQTKHLQIGLKVYETEHSAEIDETLNILPRAVQRHGKLSFAILAAHALKPRLDNLLDVSDLFVRDSTIGLVSCSAGKNGSTAQQLSSLIRDIEVHAPDEDAYLKGILFSIVDARLQLKILFGYDEVNSITVADINAAGSSPRVLARLRTNARNDYDVATRVFKNGEQVRDYWK